MSKGPPMPGMIVGDTRVLPPEEAHLLTVEGVGKRRVSRGGGRPTKCNMALLEQIATLIQGGVHPNDACGMAGVNKKSRGRWLARGRKAMEDNPNSRSIYAEFVRVMDGKSAIARGVLGAKLHKMGREGNIAAIQTWMKYFGVNAFQPPNAPPDSDETQHDTVTIEFDGAQVFGGKELGEAEDDEPQEDDVIVEEP